MVEGKSCFTRSIPRLQHADEIEFPQHAAHQCEGCHRGGKHHQHRDRISGRIDQDRQTAGLIGYVGSVRDVTFGAERLDDTASDLIVEATRLAEGDQSYMYRFTVRLDGRAIIEGRASIFIKAVS